MRGRSMRLLQDISKDLDLREIAEKYELPLDTVKETVERSISDTRYAFGHIPLGC